MFALNPIKILLDFLSPPICLISNELIGEDKSIIDCISKTSLSRLPSAPSPDEIRNQLVVSLGLDNLAISRSLALFSVDEEYNILNAIHRLKYNSYTNLCIQLGEILGNAIKSDLGDDYDAMVPVPIHKVKFRERGYNQAEKIAIGCSKKINLPIDSKIIKRTRYTTTQTLLKGEARVKNVSGVFEVLKIIEGKKLLVIDDVVTTGNTINEIAKALKNAGAKEVDVASLVKA